MLAPWIIRPKNRPDARPADTTEDDDCNDNEEEEDAQEEGDKEYIIVDGTLRISDHSLDMGGFAYILRIIKKNEELLELNLSVPPFGWKVPPSYLRVVSEQVRSASYWQPDLAHIYFLLLLQLGCNISRGDEIAEMVQNAPNLQRLVLEWNNLGLARSGIAALASAIATSRTLKMVDLRSNRIGPCTAATLAHAFRNSSSLTTLDLRWNEIGTTGATAFIGMLQKNKTVTDLRLAGNGIPPTLQLEIGYNNRS